jgi:flagellar hook-length control protein FliK
VSASAELLKPLPAPALVDRASEARSKPSAARNDDDRARFEDKLARETAEPTREAKRTQQPERTEPREPARDTAKADDTTEPETAESAATPETDEAIITGSEASDLAASVLAANDLPAEGATGVAEPELAPADPLAELTELLLASANTTNTENLAAQTVLPTATVEPLAVATAAASVPLADAEPGALGRWFMQATAPTPGLDGLNAPTAEGTPDALQQNLAAMRAQGTNVSGDPRAAGAGSPNSDGINSATFTQALADSGFNSTDSAQNFEALITKAAQAVSQPGVDADIPTATALPTGGQAMTTGAQSAVTAVPQATTGQAVPVSALAVEITRQAMNGNTKFDIRLDPPELGRLNVRLEMDASGQTRTHMIVERAETLEMLLTDARSLERALQQAGLKAEPGSVSFELASDANDNFADGFAGNGAEQNDDEASADRQSGDDASARSGELLSDEAISSSQVARQILSITGQLDVRV